MGDLKQLGAAGEEHAWQLLRRRGDKLIARNFTCPAGELDLVTWHGTTLVFTEVRLRSNQAFGSPAETVAWSKQTKVKRAARWFLTQTFKGKPWPDCRFDVVWIVAAAGAIEDSGLIEGAFC